MATRFYSSVEYGSSRGSTDPDVIYYNGALINNSVGNTPTLPTSQPDPQVEFLESRAIPILQDASDYMLSVVRFSLNGAGKSIPLWIPTIDNQQTPGFTGDLGNPNKTIYTIGISATYTTTSPTVITNYGEVDTLIWIAENSDIPAPQVQNLTTVPVADTTQGQILTSSYYYGYSYENFCNMVNTSLQNCMSNILTDLGAIFASGGTPSTPFLRYNPVTKLFSFYMDTRYFGALNSSGTAGGLSTAGATLQLNIWMNDNLELLLSNYWIEYAPFLGGVTLPSGATFTSVVPNLVVCGAWLSTNLNAPYPPIEIEKDPLTGLPYSPVTGHVYFVVTQNYQSTAGGWSPVDSVVITSFKLPIIQEQIAQPQAVGTSDFGVSNATSPGAFFPIIADYALDLKGAEDYRQFVEFVPTAEYRMVALSMSKSPIQQIDFQMWWRNRLDNNYYPLLLVNGTSVSVKMMFRRKQLGV